MVSLLLVVSCKMVSLLLVGMAMGRGGAERWGLHPASHGFVLPQPCPALHDVEYFLTPSPLIGAPRSPVLPRKTLLFVNLP